ncbi:MAG: glycine cleavage system protein H [Planctomycetota bacterium]
MGSDPPFNIPHDRHYDRVHHLWAWWDEASRRVRVGIDSIGLESLGELAYVALKEVGTTVLRGESIGTLEAAKMTTIIAAPVSGTVSKCNDAVLQDPLLVNGDPYDGGWLVEIDPANWERDAAELVSGEGIQAWVAAEVERLRTETQAD